MALVTWNQYCKNLGGGGGSEITSLGKKSTGAHLGQVEAQPHRPGSLGRATSPGMHPHVAQSCAAAAAAMALFGSSNKSVMNLRELPLLSQNGVWGGALFFFLAAGPGHSLKMLRYWVKPPCKTTCLSSPVVFAHSSSRPQAKVFHITLHQRTFWVKMLGTEPETSAVPLS